MSFAKKVELGGVLSLVACVVLFCVAMGVVAWAVREILLIASTIW